MSEVFSRLAPIRKDAQYVGGWLGISVPEMEVRVHLDQAVQLSVPDFAILLLIWPPGVHGNSSLAAGSV